MCCYTATLAQANEHQFITCCEHNMIHIVWKRSQISPKYSDSEVQQLTPFLEQRWREIGAGSFYDCCCLRYAPDEYFE
jgi:hypothetical protein